MANPDRRSAKALGRTLDSMLAGASQEASFDYRLDLLGEAGEADAFASREQVQPGVWVEWIQLRSSRPLELPMAVAALTRASVDGMSGRLSYAAVESFELAEGADPAFAHALCQACADALAPQAPSLISRLLRRRQPQPAADRPASPAP